MQHAIASREEALDKFVARISGKDVPEDVQDELCKFGAIRLCGHIEQCVKIIVLHRLSPRAQPQVISYIKSDFEQGRNLKCDRIVGLLARFDKNWAKKFEVFLEASPDIVEGVSSAYSIRNPLAHGSTGGIGLKRLNELNDISKRLLQGIVAATE